VRSGRMRQLPDLPLPTGFEVVHGRHAAHLLPAWLSKTHLQSLRGAQLGLLPEMLVSLALAAGLVPLSGATPGFAGLPGHASPGANHSDRRVRSETAAPRCSFTALGPVDSPAIKLECLGSV
jgi:hypothetical protein